MFKNLAHIILNIIGFILIIKWFRLQISDFKLLSKSNYFSINRFRSVLLVSFVVISPVALVNLTEVEVQYHLTKEVLEQNNILYAIIISFLISLVWLLYILKLDIFNREKKRHILMIFILAIFVTLLTDFPYNFIHSLGFKNSTNTISSFLYSVFGIGLIEETIKLIPVLLMLKFTKAIDEPFDYILYASVAALGFAFVENALYLNNFGLEIISARALYATVAHMAFSSILCYGLFLIKFKQTKTHPFFIFVGFYFLAIFSHGFYDFWLINETVSNFSGITTLFLLVCIHIWFLLINNTLNTSNYYEEKKKMNIDSLKKYLIFSLLSIFMFSYIYVAFKMNSDEANHFLFDSVFVYGYIIFYLVATLTKFNLVAGLLRPIKAGFRNIIPKK